MANLHWRSSTTAIISSGDTASSGRCGPPSEHEEDLSRAGGFLKSTSAARTTSEEAVQRRFRHRLPWLLLGLGGALLAADLVGSFEAHLRVHVMLVFFIPSIVYLADAVGTRRRR